MNELKIYEELTYIETYDWEMRVTPESLERIEHLLKESKFLRLWRELINTSNIKRVFTKELSDVEKVIFSIKDKQLREKIKSEVKKREKDWLRISVGVIQNLLDKHSE